MNLCPSPSTRFKPGQSGNPRGRPRKSVFIANLLQEIGDEEHEYSGMTKAEALCRMLYQMAMAGNLKAINMIFDRVDGKPRLAIEETDDHADIGAMTDEQLTEYFLENSRLP